MKKLITILTLSGILLSPLTVISQSYRNWTKVFDEQFSDNQNGWYLTNSNSRKSVITSGKLIDEFNKEGYSTVNTIPVKFDHTKDYRIKFGIANLNYGYKEKKKNIFTTYGFVWSFKDWDNYNYIIFQQGYEHGKLATYFKVASVVNGNTIIHEDWQTSVYDLNVQTAINEITITKSGNQLSFYKGDDSYVYSSEYLGKAPNENWFSDKCGIYIGHEAKVVLDYLTIEVDMPKTNTTTANPSPAVVSTTPKAWSGSGVFISKEGYIVTNHHVIDGANSLEVDLNINGKKETYTAEVISSDVSNDLAIIKINKTMQSLPYGFRAYGVNVGEKVFAMGYPLISVQGTEIKITDGIISSKTGYQNDPTTYQISAPIQPGNSGGPLFDMKGNLIGITNGGIPGADNVGYAIKSSYLLNLIESQKSLQNFQFSTKSDAKTLPSFVSSFSDFVVLIRANDPTISTSTSKSNTILKGSYEVTSYMELDYNSANGEYEKSVEKEMKSKFYFTEDIIYFKKGSNEWLMNKWTYEGYDEESGYHVFYDNFAQQIIINKDLTELYFLSDMKDEVFHKVYGYYYLKKVPDVFPKN